MTITAGGSTDLQLLTVIYMTESLGAPTSNVQKLQRSTGGVTPTNQTPEKFNPNSRAADATYTNAWGTVPTLSGNPLHAFAVNEDAVEKPCRPLSFHVPEPRKPIWVSAGAELSSGRVSIFVNDKTHIFAEGELLPRRIPNRGRRRGYYHFQHMSAGRVSGAAWPCAGGYPSEFRMIVPDDYLGPLAYPMSAALFPTGPGAVVRPQSIRVLDQARNRAQL